MNTILKKQKAVICHNLKSTCSLFKKTSNGDVIIDKNNHYLSDDTILAHCFDDGSLSSLEEGEIQSGAELTSGQLKFLGRFKEASHLWKKTFLDIPDRATRTAKLFAGLDKINWNSDGVHDKLVLDRKWAKTVKDLPLQSVVVGNDLIDDPEPTPGLLVDWLSKLKGARTEVNNFVHFPMILCEKSADESLDSILMDDTTHIGKIIASAPMNQTSTKYLELSTMEREGRVSSKVDKGDFATPRLSVSDRASLADRGVQAKSYIKKRKSTPVVKDKSLSPSLDTIGLEFYLSSPFKVKERSEPSIEYDLDSGTNSAFTHEWFNALAGIEEFQALEFHDRVLAEVVANSTRNVEEDVFIVRKIHGYSAYVIIKPTSLGSVNDPKPIFYSIVFKGDSLSDIYEPVFQDPFGWKYTDFLSTSRIRASHHMNSMPQFMMMIFENMETLGMLRESVEMEQVQSLVEPIKWCLLAHLQDKEEFSSNVSNFRYYYFSLFSGFANCKDESEQLATKLPRVIRDPLTLLAIRRLVNQHSRIDADTLSQQTSVLSAKKMQKDLSNTDGPDDSEYDKLPEVQTPFGFTITNSRSFLKAAYMSIYHNKDEAERGPAAKQIVSKMCKQEKHMTDLLESENRPESFDSDIGKDLDLYRFNANALALGCDLAKAELLNQAGIPLKDFRRHEGFDDWIEETILIPALLRTTYDAMATTRSSYVDNGEIDVRKYKKSKSGRETLEDGDEESIVGQTIKCIEAVMELRNRGVAKGLSPSDDLYELVTEFESSDSRMVIKIFKKNQLTGVREIYILTMVGRLLQRLVEDLARSICNNLHQEKLTGPDTKDSFVSEHKCACSHKSRGKKSVTINGSGDKTQWANYLHPKALTFPLFRLLPEKFHPLIAHMGNANTKKEIEIPAPLIESILKFPDTDLEDDVLNEIKSAVLTGSVSEIAKLASSRLRCKGNTMQGICHYPSSLYHLCGLMLLSAMIEKYIAEKGLESHISFEVSSDDKGFMVTIFVDEDSKQNMLMLTIEISKKMRHFERVIDSALGIRDSRLKSVTTISVSFEFNSVFYFGNSISTPIAKFTARCCDDSVQSTLHNRVSSMYSSVRQIRDNGGSGILCSLASMSQHIVMKCNLGFKNYSWFDDIANIDYNSMKLSHTGYRRICNPTTAGLTMSDFENIKFVTKNKMKNAYDLLLKRDLDSEDMPEQIVLSTIIWSRDKHEAMMERLNLTREDMTREDSLLILSAPKNKDDMTRKIKLMASSSGLSRSFVQCQRSDLLRAGMYLMWHKGFRIDSQRVNYHTLIKLLLNKPREEYIMSPEYQSYQEIEEASRFYSLKERRLRLMPRHFKPLVNYSYVRDDLVRYLRFLWMDDGDAPEQFIIDQILDECKWITTTSEEFFDSHDPVMLHRLINTIPTRKSKMKLLARGTNQAGNSIACLLRDNTSADETLTTKMMTFDSAKERKFRYEISQATSRISRWADVMCLTGNRHEVEMYAIEDLSIEANAISHGCDMFCRTKQERLCIYVLNCIARGEMISTLKLYSLGTCTNLRMTIRSDRGATYYYSSQFGCPILTRNSNGRTTDIMCENEEVLKIVSSYSRYSQANMNMINNDYRFIVSRIGYSQGSLAIGNGDITIGGLIGVSLPSLNLNRKLLDTSRSLNQESFECLKFMIDCPEDTPEGLLENILSNDSPIFVALCKRISMIEHSETYNRLLKSTDASLDVEVPNKAKPLDAFDIAVHQSSKTEFLDFLVLQEDEAYLSDSDQDSISGDADMFIDMYGDDFMRLVPGVDHYEESMKRHPDRIGALEKTIRLIRQARGQERNILTKSILDMADRIDKLAETGTWAL